MLPNIKMVIVIERLNEKWQRPKIVLMMIKGNGQGWPALGDEIGSPIESHLLCALDIHFQEINRDSSEKTI